MTRRVRDDRGGLRMTEEGSGQDKWMYLLKHMHEMTEIPKEFRDPLFTRLFKLAKINKFTADEYKQYQQSLENMGEFDNIIHSTEERSRAEGRVEGIAEGSRNKAVEIARNMLLLSMDVETIAKVTGLSAEEVEALKE